MTSSRSSVSMDSINRGSCSTVVLYSIPVNNCRRNQFSRLLNSLKMDTQMWLLKTHPFSVNVHCVFFCCRIGLLVSDILAACPGLLRKIKHRCEMHTSQLLSLLCGLHGVALKQQLHCSSAPGIQSAPWLPDVGSQWNHYWSSLWHFYAFGTFLPRGQVNMCLFVQRSQLIWATRTI